MCCDGFGISLWMIPPPAVIHWQLPSEMQPWLPRLSPCSILPEIR